MAFDGEAFVDRFEGILAMMTDDVIFEASFGKDPWGSRVVGKPAVREFLEEMFERVADIRWDEIRHIASPELVVVEWLTSGTPRGATRFEVQGCNLLTLRNGKIAAKRSYRKGQL
jgi:ketosteroid isomerase-like protein